MFPFTFSVPGITNPFAPTTGGGDTKGKQRPDKIPILRPRPPRERSISPAPVKSKKRGWEPSFAEPSLSTATLASSNGYLDTPAKYRDTAVLTVDEFHEMEAMAEELPPPSKRRRGLTGSIVSTAVSAALIGTAVGLTVYRMWRDRGKEPEQLPPPPYHPGEWAPAPAPIPKPEAPRAINVFPPTPRRKTRAHQVGSVGRRSTAVRRPRARVPAYTPPPVSQASSSSLHHSSSSQLLLDDAPDDQMDWIGDKLQALIEEGKRALGREVVVMSEAPEDEVDDGSDAWEEEEDYPSSLRRPKRGPSSYPSPPPSAFDLGSKAIPIQRRRERSCDSSLSTTPRFIEDTSAWSSPLLRESMEQARARALKNRGL